MVVCRNGQGNSAKCAELGRNRSEELALMQGAAITSLELLCAFCMGFPLLAHDGK